MSVRRLPLVDLKEKRRGDSVGHRDLSLMLMAPMLMIEKDIHKSKELKVYYDTCSAIDIVSDTFKSDMINLVDDSGKLFGAGQTSYTGMGTLPLMVETVDGSEFRMALNVLRANLFNNVCVLGASTSDWDFGTASTESINSDPSGPKYALF